MKKIIILVGFLFCLGCASPATPDLVVANALQADALDKVQEGREVVILAYEKELLDAYAKQLDLIAAAEIAKVQQPANPAESRPSAFVVPVEDVERIMAMKEAARERIAGTLAAKRAEFLVDDNLESAQAINAVTRTWMKASADSSAEFQAHVEQLLSEVKIK